MLLPEFGLHGKWPAEQRLVGIEPVLASAGGRTVLDLGAAEGWIALSMLRAGASLVHGLEIDASRVEAANKLCAEYPGARFAQGDLSDWAVTLTRTADFMLKAYDTVLYLGVHHHLPKSSRMETLRGAASLATSMLAIRTSAALYAEDELEKTLQESGWHLVHSSPSDPESRLGATWIFER